MAKKVIAKTNISYGKSDGETVQIPAGEEVDTKGLGMTRKQLEELYDAGALEFDETADERNEDKEKASEENEATMVDEPVVPPAAPTKSTPTKATASEAKSGGKGNAA